MIILEAPRLLQYLSMDAYLSGEAIASRLGVSRAAVWKEIEALRRWGYQVEAVPRKGYRLSGRPDRLYPWEVMAKLKTSFVGHSIIYFSELDSTNNYCRSIIGAQPEEGTVVVAETQTAGRGRLGRSWSSVADKGVWMSLILRPRLPLVEWPKLMMMAAVAVRKALAETAEVSALIKWPNDLVVQGKKICGILAELSGEPDRMSYLVLGIGINVNQNLTDFPEELQGKASSLRVILDGDVDRLQLFASILEQLEAQYLRLQSGDFSELLKEYRRHSATIGNVVTVKDGTRSLTGLAEAVLDDGGLKLELENGEKTTVYAGDTV